jgi:hypothetical protein
MPPGPENAYSVYTELVQRLTRAVDIEQALMAQYLYAAFAIKPKYENLRGRGRISEHYDLLGVAVEEMRHLHIASLLLAKLGVRPNVGLVSFPFDFNPYRFKLELKPLSAETLAQYVYIEAQDFDVSLSNPDQAFITRLRGKLGNSYDPIPPPSIYEAIIRNLKELIKDPPSELLTIAQELPSWVERLEAVRGNGIHEHFTFFRDVFMGTSPLVADPKNRNVWDLSKLDPDSPSYALLLETDGDGADEFDLRKDEARAHARLARLHYWIIVSLLNMTYRFDDWDDPEDGKPRRYLDLAQHHMRGPLLKVGAHLASKGLGLPFVKLPQEYIWDNEDAAKETARGFVNEAEELAHDLFEAKTLANGFKLNIYSITTSRLSGK